MAESQGEITTTNPATGEKGKSYPAHSLDQVKEAARQAKDAQKAWRRTSFAERSAVLRKVAELLRARADDYVTLMTEEIGKTRTEGLAEVEKCAAHCDCLPLTPNATLLTSRSSSTGKGRRSSRSTRSALYWRSCVELPLLAGDPLCRTSADGG